MLQDLSPVRHHDLLQTKDLFGLSCFPPFGSSPQSIWVPSLSPFGSPPQSWSSRGLPRPAPVPLCCSKLNRSPRELLWGVPATPSAISQRSGGRPCPLEGSLSLCSWLGRREARWEWRAAQGPSEEAVGRAGPCCQS